jgi:1-acyl-sn-glycerol-3-phosphate acyltransferase
VKLNEIKRNLLDEIFKALGLENSHPIRPLLEPIFVPAAGRFAEVAARFDDDVAAYGFRAAARRLLPYFTREVRVRGAEHIPVEGPLLVVSNHPGTVDGLVIASSLPRPDLKIVVSGVPFIRSLAATTNHLIYSSLNTFERMNVVRSAIRHLENGGAVLIFPSGGIDPDPAVMTGALGELDNWSPSLDVILRRVPATRVLITAVSGVLHAGWVRSPLTLVRSGRRNQQRVAEFFQIIQQTLFPNSLKISPSVCFAEPLQIAPNGNSPLLPAIIASAKAHFHQLKG